MSDEQQVTQPINTAPAAGFDGGYESDEVKVSPFIFGLNAGTTFLKIFEWTGTGGKDGAPQEALDIVLMINGGEKKYRKFPVTQAYDKNNAVVTDPSAQEFKDAQRDLKASVVHILHAFVDENIIKAALSRPFDSFKQWCQVCASLLPKGFDTIPLDIFLHYQWQITGESTRTFLDIPKNMKHGQWLTKSQGLEWSTLKVENPTAETPKALMYVTYKEQPKKDAAGVEIVVDGKPEMEKVIDKTHPFTRTGWFMLSNHAKLQTKEGGNSSSVSAVAATAGTVQAGQQAANSEDW